MAVKKLVIRRQFSGYKGDPGRKMDPKSKTIPDMSIGVKQLLLNHARGIHNDIREYQGQYFEDVEIPVIRDITDLLENKTKLREELREVQKEIEAVRRTNEEAAIQKAQEEAKASQKLSEQLSNESEELSDE